MKTQAAVSVSFCRHPFHTPPPSPFILTLPPSPPLSPAIGEFLNSSKVSDRRISISLHEIERPFLKLPYGYQYGLRINKREPCCL
ncbi:hypothetical protein AAHA92_19289 [Salvia divinorum]|uniref:Uncharacterized protein n=1 Tax=Salvia divinorum TaxID=28513 RepID=A0ABD1H4U9_SALDI